MQVTRAATRWLPVLGLMALALAAAPSQAASHRVASNHHVSGAGVSRTGHAARPMAGPARPVRTGSTGQATQFTSRNWAGYVAYNAAHSTDFNVVRATWVQRRVTCPQPNAWTVFWVGLDGWWDGTVEQGGSSARCINGTPHYTLWWEMFPTNAIQTVLTIKAGDTVTASVTYQPATKVFVIFVKDVTTGASFTRSPKCGSGLTCNRSSTEVIAEDVGMSGGGGYFPLANYGTIAFTGSSMTGIHGHTGSFTDPNWQHASVVESGGGITYATVSALTNLGRNFTATWHHA
jgi:hypothetical protein